MSVQISDIVVPRVFTQYTLKRTAEVAAMVQSGFVQMEPMLDDLLREGGLTFDMPYFQPLANTAENVSDDVVGNKAVPMTITTGQEIAVRLSRNAAWGQMALARTLAGANPFEAIQTQLAIYWALRLQKMLIAMVSGIAKDNGANDGGDFAYDVVPAGANPTFADGVTNFTTKGFLQAKQKMGDAKAALTIILTHSAVSTRMEGIVYDDTEDFSPQNTVRLATWQGHRVVVFDGMPSGAAAVRAGGTAGVAGVYETWIAGPGVIRLGMADPVNAEGFDTDELAGSGGGQEFFVQRVQWLPHMPGISFVATAAKGGPTNAASAGNLNHAGSWNRVINERKLVPLVRYITQES